MLEVWMRTAHLGKAVTRTCEARSRNMALAAALIRMARSDNNVLFRGRRRIVNPPALFGVGFISSGQRKRTCGLPWKVIGG